jgi:hypothetical protein
MICRIEKETKATMKRTLILILASSSCTFAQESGNVVYRTAEDGGNVAYQGAGPASAVAWGATFDKALGIPVQGAPYSATITNESIQTLADGNRIVQTSTGTTARDSQGRTRQDMALPAIGNLSAANAPHLVFIQDPVVQTSYTLNLTDKSAQRIPVLSAQASGSSVSTSSGAAFLRMGNANTVSIAGPLPLQVPLQAGALQKGFPADDEVHASREDLGTQTIEGVLVKGVRTTHTIPAGQIGNDKPINIITEVWTSPDLKIIVSSKRSDPRMGDQTFQLTNIMRVEPDPSLFTVPADFKIIDGPQPNIIYRPKQ